MSEEGERRKVGVEKVGKNSDSEEDYGDSDSDSDSWKDKDPEVEKISEEIRKNLKELDDIRAKCNGKVNKDIKFVIGQIRENSEELSSMAIERGNIIENLRKDKRELEKKVWENAENREQNEDIQKEILKELKSLREEVKALREENAGKDKGINQDREIKRGNMEVAGDVGKGTKSYAESVGKKVTQNGTTGKRDRDRKEGEGRVEVIKIKSQEEYPVLVGKIRKQADPKVSDVSVISLKKDDQGHILIKLQGKQENRSRYREELKKCVEEKGSLEKIQRMEYIHLANLDILTTEKEIEEKICAETGIGKEEVKVTSLRPAYGESQKATVKVPKEAAERLAGKRKIGIGMTACRT